ncbi:MAG: ABC transporter ATP-binding protein [Clostridia bacterium]|nr:ABC transporter ATP-binding protein [Clostridia bacterium]
MKKKEFHVETKKAENVNSEDEKIPFWKTIMGFAKGEYRRFIIAIIASALTGIVCAFQPLVIRYIVDEGISAFDKANDVRLTIVGIFCIVYIVLSLLRVGFWALGYNLSLKILEGIIFKIRSSFFYHVEHLCMRFYENISAGELYNSLMGSPISNIRNYLSQMILTVPYHSVSFAISLAALFTYDWLLTLVLLLTAIVMVVFNWMSRKKVRRISREYIKTEAQASKYITNILHGMDAVKLYAIEDNVYHTFRDYVNTIKTEGVRLAFSQYKEGVMPEITNFVGTALIYFVGALSCIYRGVSTGTLFAFISSMSIILSTLTAWLNLGLVKQSADSGLRKVMDVLNVESTTPEVELNKMRDTNIEKQATQRKNKPCIEFNNVEFAYADTPVYKDLTCSIGYNESIGLVGSSGSGKSTFTKLIMRLYDVQNGEVKIHGRNVKDYSLRDLRMTFGVVPQQPFIFQGTIMDNIRIARPDCANIDIINAMEIAHVHEFVNELPKGWNTVIGDGGLNLSGGQKQRIAIARAVLGNPDILIFDEATSALDNISERHIQEAMETLMKDHTVLIVAHRLSTIKNVDRIMVFDQGEIIEEGTYDELSKIEGGFFANLLNN